MTNSKIIVALDFNDMNQTMDFVAKFKPGECRFKVGKELFTAYGPDIIRKLHVQGFEVFLDLKFHDIPNTVYKAIRAACDLGVWMVNVHASGGRQMLQSARQAVNDSQHKSLLIAVTLLTSLGVDEVKDIGFLLPLDQQVVHLAQLAYECGLDGVVCSAEEALAIKEATDSDFLAVTPGIRLTTALPDDQTRVMTPVKACANGADYLVIGRPITQAANPEEILKKINAELIF